MTTILVKRLKMSIFAIHFVCFVQCFVHLVKGMFLSIFCKFNFVVNLTDDSNAEDAVTVEQSKAILPTEQPTDRSSYISTP